MSFLTCLTCLVVALFAYAVYFARYAVLRSDYASCGCVQRRGTRGERMRAVADECKEIVEVASVGEFVDELSDIIFGVSHIITAELLPGSNIRVAPIPGSGLHIDKMRSRYKEYGCIRSRRHLVRGACPHLGEK